MLRIFPYINVCRTVLKAHFLSRGTQIANSSIGGVSFINGIAQWPHLGHSQIKYRQQARYTYPCRCPTSCWTKNIAHGTTDFLLLRDIAHCKIIILERRIIREPTILYTSAASLGTRLFWYRDYSAAALSPLSPCGMTKAATTSPCTLTAQQPTSTIRSIRAIKQT